MFNKQQDRWRLAQDYELDWWKDYDKDIEWYRGYSQQVERYVEPYLKIEEETRILEIGSGAAGALTFLNSNNKFAIDPLEHYFSSQKKYTEFRDQRVSYRTGKGENLPYQANFFDLVILDNVLDHCEEPLRAWGSVMSSVKGRIAVHPGKYTTYMLK